MDALLGITWVVLWIGLRANMIPESEISKSFFYKIVPSIILAWMKLRS